MSNRPSEESEASRLKLRFKKTSDRTKVFEEWDESVKTFFRSRAQLDEGELPIVTFFENNSCWFLTIERKPNLFNRVKGLFKTFTARLNETPSVDQLNGAYDEIAAEWISLWKEMTLREHYLSSVRPEKFQEFTMVGDSISFKTPEFVDSSAENLQEAIIQFEKTIADLAPQCEALARIRKLILWAVIMFEPSAFNEIAREYLRIARLVVDVCKQCRKEKYAPDAKVLDLLILNCDELEHLLIQKTEHTVQEFVSTSGGLLRHTIEHLRRRLSSLRNERARPIAAPKRKTYPEHIEKKKSRTQLTPSAVH